MSNRSKDQENISLWSKVERNTDLFDFNNLESFYNKIGEATGEEAIHEIDEDSFNNKGFVSIWIAISYLHQMVKDVASEFGEQIYTNESEINQLKERVDKIEEKSKEISRHSKGLSEKEIDVLVGLKNGEKQKDIAKEIGVTESWVSQIKTELEEKGLYSDE